MINGEDPLRGPAQPPRHASRRPGAPQETVSLTAPEQCAATSLRLQALEIIDSLLNSTELELEEVRSGLGRHVKEHPWDPEIALLLHLWDRAQDLPTPRDMKTAPPVQPPNGTQATTLPPGSPPGDQPGARPLPG